MRWGCVLCRHAVQGLPWRVAGAEAWPLERGTDAGCVDRWFPPVAEAGGHEHTIVSFLSNFLLLHSILVQVFTSVNGRCWKIQTIWRKEDECTRKVHLPHKHAFPPSSFWQEYILPPPKHSPCWQNTAKWPTARRWSSSLSTDAFFTSALDSKLQYICEVHAALYIDSRPPFKLLGCEKWCYSHRFVLRACFHVWKKTGHTANIDLSLDHVLVRIAPFSSMLSILNAVFWSSFWECVSSW